MHKPALRMREAHWSLSSSLGCALPERCDLGPQAVDLGLHSKRIASDPARLCQLYLIPTTVCMKEPTACTPPRPGTRMSYQERWAFAEVCPHSMAPKVAVRTEG